MAQTTERATNMVAYHGTALYRLPALLESLRSGDQLTQRSWIGLWITDTPERAARYANAQARRLVDPDAITIAEHAAIVELEVPGDLYWTRRQSDHPTLDLVESVTKTARLSRVVEARTCEYENCVTCQTWRAYM